MSDEKTVFRAAIEEYGAYAQSLMLLEEMAELQKEVCKSYRGNDNTEQIAEEIADVEIMLAQIKMIYGVADEVARYRRDKVARLWKRLRRENA